MLKKLNVLQLLGGFFVFSTAMCAASPPSNTTCLATAIYNEAGGESIAGQYAVGTVILNRVDAGIEQNVCKVINQHRGNHWQFGFNAGRKRPIPIKQKQYFMELAALLIVGKHRTLPKNVLYFNNKRFLSRKYRLYRKIGRQQFFILDEA